MEQTLSGIQVLVVEDEPMLRELIARALGDQGAVVTRAENGAVAWQLCETAKFDAILTDVRMPGGDGLAFLAKVQARPGPHPKVFVCSGFDDLDQTNKAGLRIDRIFEKPFRLKDVVASVSERLGRGS